MSARDAEIGLPALSSSPLSTMVMSTARSASVGFQRAQRRDHDGKAIFHVVDTRTFGDIDAPHVLLKGGLSNSNAVLEVPETAACAVPRPEPLCSATTSQARCTCVVGIQRALNPSASSSPSHDALNLLDARGVHRAAVDVDRLFEQVDRAGRFRPPRR